MISKLDQAKDPNTSAEALEGLTRDGDYTIIWYVARNANATPKILTKLALWQHDYFDNYTWVIRDQVRQHHNTPPLVKIWLQGGYGEMSLQDFLEAVR